MANGNKSKASGSKETTVARGFARGLEAKAITGASDLNIPRMIYFVVKWKGLEDIDLVPAEESNKILLMVIKYNEERRSMQSKKRVCPRLTKWHIEFFVVDSHLDDSFILLAVNHLYAQIYVYDSLYVKICM